MIVLLIQMPLNLSRSRQASDETHGTATFQSYAHTMAGLSNPKDLRPFFVAKVRLGELPHENVKKPLFLGRKQGFIGKTPIRAPRNAEKE